MPQKYYNVGEVADVLGISPDDVRQMLENRELHGYRDGADWKFKSEDIDRIARERVGGGGSIADSGELGDVLLTDSSIGVGDPGTSGTVIGGQGANAPAPTDSDLILADSDIGLVASSGPGDTSVPTEGTAAGRGPLDDLDMTLDGDLTLEDSHVSGSSPTGGLSGSSLDLGGDDDLVLSGSGSGSDITLGGDSGISLVDPADSGISLDEPLQMGGGQEESLELGEDDLLSLAEASATGMKTDDDFLLTPVEDTADIEDSESGSQVIALDSEADEGATMVAPSRPGMGAMLAEAGGVSTSMPIFSPSGSQPQVYGAGAPMVDSMPAEAPYTTGNIVALGFALFFLMLTGMFMYDLMRNMWSWGGVSSVNSSIMDTILGLFGQ